MVKNRRFLVKSAAFLLCAAIMFVCGACANEHEDNVAPTVYTAAATTEKTAGGVGELYACFSASDSLNPYKAVTMINQQICSLLFDPLVRLDADLNPEMMLAKKVVIDGRDINITLKDATFSDNSPVTADDVIYSLSLAKSAKNSVFPEQLAVVDDYNALDSDSLVITLKKPSPLGANLLDFPIIKIGTTGRKNKDDKPLPPIGCGRYVYNDNSGTYTLTGNKNYYGAVPTNKITLSNTPDREALQYSVKAGEVDIYYSGMSNDGKLSMSGKTSRVKETNIVILGVNERGVLADSRLRQAVSLMIDRKVICRTAYYDYAYPATSLYPGSVDILKDMKPLFSESANESAAKEYLKQAGYTLGNDGVYENKYGTDLGLTLVYNASNSYQKNAAEMIGRSLKFAGIRVYLADSGYDYYTDVVARGGYDLYLGEVKLNKDFDFSAFFSGKLGGETEPTTTKKPAPTTAARPGMAYIAQTDEDGDPVYGNDGYRVYKWEKVAATTAAKTTKSTIPENIDMEQQYNKYVKGSLATRKFLQTFGEQLPFIPIAYRYSMVSYNSGITPAAVSTVSDAYYNIEQLSLKKQRKGV